MYKILFTKRAAKDAAKATKSNLKETVQELLDIIKVDPYHTPPKFKQLTGDLKGAISRRINIKHRLVYQVREDVKVIVILSLWNHY